MNRPVLAEHERWHSVGAQVVELTRLGRDHHRAQATEVVRLTPRQIVTATGRRFWRYGASSPLALVGQSDARAAGIPINPMRLVPPDNRHAVAAVALAAEGN